MRSKALFMLALMLIVFSSGCKQDRKDLQKETFQKEHLIGKYFGVSFEGEDDLHVLQFNLYKMPSGEIKGDFYNLFAAFDPIPQEVLNNHINNTRLIDQNIFNVIKPHVGYIEKASLAGNKISFTTSFIEYDKDTYISWSFTGRTENKKAIGKITQFFTPIYDETKTINVAKFGKVQTFSKSFSFTKVE